MTDVPDRSRESVFDTLQSELSGLWQRLWHGGIHTGPFDGQDLAPPVEVREYAERYVLLAELPGVNRAALEVSANATTVTLTGQKAVPVLEASAESPDSRVIRSERRYGRFRREIMMPGAILPETVRARLCDGVLEVTAAKAPHSMPISIQINTPHP